MAKVRTYVINNRTADDDAWWDALPSRPRKLRLYVDEDVPAPSVYALRGFGSDALYVPELGTKSRDDRYHYKEARRLGRILVTNDADFWNDRLHPLALSPGVVLIECGTSRDPYQTAILFYQLALDVLLRGISKIPGMWTQTKLRISSEQVLLRMRTSTSSVEQDVLWARS